MSNIAPAPVRNTTPDPRVERTIHALGRALVQLIEEREYDAITVQQILDRAGVSRATFYAHYRNKDDALHSSYARLFALFEEVLERKPARARGLFPVAEFVAHIGEARSFALALHRAGRLEVAFGMFAAHAAAIIERRLGIWPGVRATVSPPLVARMLAGALLEMIRWWWEDPARATPAEMDAAFHELARGVLRRVPA
jgi:AcrR family transcriptional regulator